MPPDRSASRPYRARDRVGLSGFVVGVAGALYGHYFVTFGPDDFFFNQGFNIVLLTIAMLVVGGMTSVTGAVVGCYFITVIYEAFRRWEVNGLGGVTPPSGTANFVLAVILVVTLVLRPKGITGGREIPWPGDWSLRRSAGSVAGPASAAAKTLSPPSRRSDERHARHDLAPARRPQGAPRRRRDRRVPGGAAPRPPPRRRRHRDELARRQPRGLVVPRGRRRSHRPPGDGRGPVRVAARRGGRRPRDEPPEHEALLD